MREYIASTMPKTSTTSEKQKTFSFYLPPSLYEDVSAFVDRHRNAPESMSINSFAREALREKLERELKKEARR